jgi:hypothetical protein
MERSRLPFGLELRNLDAECRALGKFYIEPTLFAPSEREFARAAGNGSGPSLHESVQLTLLAVRCIFLLNYSALAFYRIRCSIIQSQIS